MPYKRAPFSHRVNSKAIHQVDPLSDGIVRCLENPQAACSVTLSRTQFTIGRVKLILRRASWDERTYLPQKGGKGTETRRLAAVENANPR